MGLRRRTCAYVAMTLMGSCVTAAQVTAATVTAVVTARPIKPLTLTKVQDLDLGTVTLGPGTWSNGAVSISQGGVLSCANINITCAGATKAAEYSVEGSKQEPVYVDAPNVTLANQSDISQTLTLVTDAPISVMLKNSGHQGTSLFVGGSIQLNSSTPAGTCVGTFNVTVDY